MTATVTTQIDLYQALNAIREFAKKYDVERLSPQIAKELLDAARLILVRLEHTKGVTPEIRDGYEVGASLVDVLASNGSTYQTVKPRNLECSTAVGSIVSNGPKQ